MTERTLRWLLVAQDGWGLGHVSRQIGLGRELRKRRPEDEVLILTRSEACHLVWREGFANLKLPSLELSGSRFSRSLSSGSEERLVRSVVHACAVEYCPHAVVIDTFPAGAGQELTALLDAPAYRFLIGRENRFLPLAVNQAALARFDLVVLPYRPGEIEAPIPAGPRVEWVGPMLVRSQEDALPRAEARARLGLAEKGRVCLVSFGGGGNPDYDRLDAWVLGLARHFRRWTFAITRAPLHRGRAPETRARNVRCFEYYPMAECYDAFDAAISATGSTSYELAHFGVPSILVPDANRLPTEDFRDKARRVLGARGGFVVGRDDTAGLRAAFETIDDDEWRRSAAASLLERAVPNGAAVAVERMVETILAGAARAPS